MIYLYAFLILILIALVYMRFEASFVEVKRVKLTKGIKYLKIIQLSDIHINHLRVSSKRVARIIERERPDLIFLSGDYIEKARHIPKFMKFLDDISGFCCIYLCFGNHDYKAFGSDDKEFERFKRDIKRKGIHILNNSSVCYEKNHKKYNIIGVEDFRSGQYDVHAALNSCCEDASLNIAFSHNPDIILKIPKGKVDYLFCGHFHGGQIWAPFGLEFKLLRSEKLCKMGIKRGMHELFDINLYISRGLGNVLFPLRFRSRPEITVLYLP